MHSLPTAARKAAFVLALVAAWPVQAADTPGRGISAEFEVAFMRFTIDHHFAAMRMTELAAGTDPQRDAEILPTEGTSQTPGFQASPGRAQDDAIRSLARRNNRMQREEIGMLQRMLRTRYGVDHRPQVPASGRVLIEALEASGNGAGFEQAFLKAFSRHHYTLLGPINGCMTATDPKHHELRRLCSMMWHSQTGDIEEMREMLDRRFGVPDWRPFDETEAALASPSSGPRGRSSAGR